MMSLGGDKILCMALFRGTDSDCSSSIESDEEKCRIQNAGREVTYMLVVKLLAFFASFLIR